VTNGPNYRVKGAELQAIAVVMDGLTVTSSASYNKSTQQNSPALINNNPASPGFGKPIVGVENVFGAAGTPLAQSPLFQGNLRVRYEFPIGDYHAFTQAGGQYYGDSYSSVGTIGNYHMGGYGTFDLSAGVAKDAWNVQLFAQNVGNKNAASYISTAQFIETETIIRPRIAGLKFGYKF
jgi:hypothetical protein